jgi:DNA-binding transcriptional MerR regulator
VGHTVGEIARLTGQTVRTLHHYDRIGLLVPAERSPTGYRLYSRTDLDRLHRILTYRELGFPLERISELLDDPDPRTHLARQHQLVNERIDHLREVALTLQRMMEAEHMGTSLTPQEQFEVFGDFDVDTHTEEARRRWGGQDGGAFAESRRRTSSYTKEDWQQINTESDGIYRALAEAMNEGLAPDSETVTDLAERHRAHISRHYYDCTPQIHRGLGQMYVDDERFTATIDAYGEGLSPYLREAFAANAARRER